MRNENDGFEKLGPKIKELRINMKLTQAEVAKALNVTPGYIRMWKTTVRQCPCGSSYITQN